MLGVSGVLVLGYPSMFFDSTEYPNAFRETSLEYFINAKENGGCAAILTG